MTEVVTTWRLHGLPCWVSLLVRDLETARDFHGRLFGRRFEYGLQPLGPYARGELNGRPIAGLGEVPGGRRLPAVWTTYFAAGDVDVATARIRSCGGTVAVGPLDADDAGRMSIASDSVGAVFGVWRAKADHGAELTGEPGTLTWNELLTRETSAAGDSTPACSDARPRRRSPPTWTTSRRAPTAARWPASTEWAGHCCATGGRAG